MADIKDIVTHCPDCGTLHLDVGEWHDREHKTHLCLSCGAIWRPHEFPTRGVPEEGRGTATSATFDASRNAALSSSLDE